MTARALLAILLIPILLTPTSGTAQQILEIDYSVGRTIIDDEWRAMRDHDLAVDWDRNLLYVHDSEEPDGIMVFSLETGEWVRTISTPRGGGPLELPQGKGLMALAEDGGLYVAGYQRVLMFDSSHEQVNSWTPAAPITRPAVCDMGGKPAIPVPDGVLRHETEAIGPNAVVGRSIDDVISGSVGEVSSEDEAVARVQAAMARTLGARARIVCTEDRAFVVRSYSDIGSVLGGLDLPRDGTVVRREITADGPDSVFVYHRSGEVGRVAVPTEFTEEWGCQIGGRQCPPWSHDLHPSLDDRGNLVLFSGDFRVGGAIIDPDTDCYAIVQKDMRTDRARVPVRVRGDSVLVFQYDQGVTEDGRPHLFVGSSNKVSMHPLRRVSGEPCEGMAPGG